MKNRLLTAISGVVLATMVTTAPSAMELSGKGVKVGLNMASASGSDSDISGSDKKFHMGFALGGFVNMDLGNNLVLRPEVMYIQKGVNYEAGSVESVTSLSYIDIPILVEYGVLQGNMPVNVFGGVNLAVLLSGENEISGGGAGVDGTTDIKSDTSGFDYGLQFGVGTVINKNIAVDVRYSLGLAKLDKDGDFNSTNSGFMLTGGYMF